MENDQVFDNDISSRYAARREAPLVRGSAQAQESMLARQVAEGPDKTVAGFVWNFERAHQNNLTSLLRARKFAEAKSYYDNMCQTIEANRDDIGILTQVAGFGGPTSKALAEKAMAISQYDFDKWEVELTDGTKANVGQILQDGSDFLGMKTRDLNALGFSDRTAGMYLQGDETQRQTFGAIIDPFVRQTQSGKLAKGAPVVPNHDQLTKFADDLSTNWDVVTGVFGTDGVMPLVNFVKSSHETAGNMSATMRTLTKMGAAIGGDVTGAERADRVANMYKELRNFSLGGDKTADGGQAEFSDNQLRQFDAVIVPAVQEFANRGLRFDANNARTRAAFKSIMDTLSYASAAGADLFSDSRPSGADINGAFANYVADSTTMDNPPANNLVVAHKNLRTSLDNTVLGARDSADTRVQMTGKSQDYLSVDKANGKVSSNPFLDNIALGVKQHIYRAVSPYLASGKRASESLEYIMGNRELGDKFMSGLAESIRGNFHGPGSEYISQVIATNMIEGVMTNRPTNIQDVVESILNDPDLAKVVAADDAGAIPENDIEARNQAAMMKTLGRWYHGATAGRELFGRQLAKIENHYRSQGFSDSRVRATVARCAERMSALLDKGVSPDIVARSALSVGRALVPKYDPKTGELVDITSVPANLDKVDFRFRDRNGNELTVPKGTYSNDREAWDTMQSYLEEEKKVLDAARLRKQKIAEQNAAYEDRLDARDRHKGNGGSNY